MFTNRIDKKKDNIVKLEYYTVVEKQKRTELIPQT